MKRREVYNTILKFNLDVLLKKNPSYYNTEILKESLALSKDKVNKIIDRDYSKIYKKSGNPKIEIALCCGIVALSTLFLPLKSFYNFGIGLGICTIVEFAIHKGFRFLVKDFSNTNVKKSINFKPKWGVYEPVVLGLTTSEDTINDEVKESVLQVYKVGDIDVKTLERPRFYIADKEVLGNIIDDYIMGKPNDMQNMSKDICSVIDESYNFTVLHRQSLDSLDDSQIESLKKSDSFNK